MVIAANLDSTDIVVNKKLVRIDVSGFQRKSNDSFEAKHIILSQDNKIVNTDLFDVYQYDYCKSMNFSSESTFTYYLINKFSGILCRVDNSEVDVFIHLPEGLKVYDYNHKNCQVFYNHINEVFVFDIVLSDRSLLNMEVNSNVLNSSSSNVANPFKYSIVQSPIEEYIPSSVYQLNNHTNLLALKDGGLILSSKVERENLIVEYRNKIYGKVERKGGLRSLFSALKTEKTNNYIADNSEYLKDLVLSTVLLPENRLFVLTDKLDLLLLKLTGFDAHLGEIPESSLSLELLSKINILEFLVSDWKSLVGNSFLESKVQINSDFTKLVFYLPNENGNYLLAELNYDIQSVDSANLVTSLSGFHYLENESERFSTVKNDFDFVDYKISDSNDIYCLLKSKSFSNQTKNEFIVMKYYNGKWTTTFQDQILKVNHIGQLEAVDVTQLTAEQQLDLSIAFKFCYNLSAEVFFDDSNSFLIKDKKEWFEIATAAKKRHLEKINEPCGLSFKNSDCGLLSVNLKNYSHNADATSAYYLPAFKLPFEDKLDFFKMIKEICNVFSMSQDSLSIGELIRECIKEDDKDISVEILKSKYKLINIQEFVLYLNSRNIEDVISVLKQLAEYESDIVAPFTLANNGKSEQILLDYVYYKNYQLMALYLNILLCFKYVDMDNEELLTVLNKILKCLKKRFKFDLCYKFNKNAIFDIFIAKNNSFNLSNVENLIVSSEYLLHNVLINDYDDWNENYQLYHLQKAVVTQHDLGTFIRFIQTFDYNAKLKNIALLDNFNFEKVLDSCLVSDSSFKINFDIDNYDAKTLSLINTTTSFNYVTCLFTLFVDFYKNLDISNKLSKIIVDNYINGKEDLAENNSQLAFYKHYIKLISEYGKYAEILETLLAKDSLLTYEDKYDIYDQLLARFSLTFLKAIIQYNYSSDENILPFNQFAIVKKLVFSGIKNKAFTLVDYVKLLLSYDDKRSALKVLYYLANEDNEESLEVREQYRTLLLSLLYTLPKEERWLVDYSGTIINIEHILSS